MIGPHLTNRIIPANALSLLGKPSLSEYNQDPTRPKIIKKPRAGAFHEGNTMSELRNPHLNPRSITSTNTYPCAKTNLNHFESDDA